MRLGAFRAVTDAEGLFQVTGVGRDRVVLLNVNGPGIRSTSFGVLTRDDVADFTRTLRDRYPQGLRNGDSHWAEGTQFFGPAQTIEVQTARTIGGRLLAQCGASLVPGWTEGCANDLRSALLMAAASRRPHATANSSEPSTSKMP